MYRSRLSTLYLLMLVLYYTYAVDKFEWLQNPGVIHSLEGSNVTFLWTHTGPVNVEITWFNIGTEDNPQRVTLMLFTQNKTIAYGDMKGRLEYLREKGSASIVLTGVTPGDANDYEAKVVRVLEGNQPDYINSVARLFVYRDLIYTIQIDNITLDLSVNNNGSTITLPPDVATVPHIYSVQTWIDEPLPSKTETFVIKTVGQTQMKQPVCIGKFCHRLIDFERDDGEYLTPGDTSLHTQIVIVINFSVQGLPNVTITQNITLKEPEHEKEHREKNRMITKLVVGLLIPLVFIMGFIPALVLHIKYVRKHKASQKPPKGETYELEEHHMSEEDNQSKNQRASTSYSDYNYLLRSDLEGLGHTISSTVIEDLGKRLDRIGLCEPSVTRTCPETPSSVYEDAKSYFEVSTL